VEKGMHRLTLFHGRIPLKSYRVALGRSPAGQKQCEGDHRTPEGIYTIDGRNRESTCYRALHISYPSHGDRTRGGTAWRGAWRRQHDSRDRPRIRMVGIVSSSLQLDFRMHRRHRRGDGGDLASGPKRDAGRDSAVMLKHASGNDDSRHAIPHLAKRVTSDPLPPLPPGSIRGPRHHRVAAVRSKPERELHQGAPRATLRARSSAIASETTSLSIA
jgi:hypothetical protein